MTRSNTMYLRIRQAVRVWMSVAMVVSSLAAVFGAGMNTAAAQSATPDVRAIPPRILLALDSSGSMERKICQCTHPETCVCASGEVGCEDCQMTATDCGTGATASGPVRNRMQTLVEVLTGSFYNKAGAAYACTVEARTAGNGYLASYPDYGNSMNHVLYNGPIPPAVSMTIGQYDDGILDTYNRDAEFALMTFDSVSTLKDDGFLASTIAGPPLWNAAYGLQTRKALGGFSYGEDKEFTFPNCADTYMTNTGAKSFLVDGWPANTPGGAHFGVGPLFPFPGLAAASHVEWEHTRENAPGAGSTESFDSFGDILDTSNAAAAQDLQKVIQTMRPYGSTPLAGMLDDIRYFYGEDDDDAHDSVADPLNDQAGDPDKDQYGSCRENYVVLMTDGIGNLDFRGAPFFCEASPTETCPYDTPEAIISDLVTSGKVKRVYVIGFNLPDDINGNNEGKDALELYAAAGGTTLFTPSTGEDLRAAFSEIISETLREPSSRTLPAFATGYSSTGSSQAQFNSGFRPNASGEAWSGVLERRQYVCDDGAPVLQPTGDEDRFQDLLDDQRAAGTRKLYTVVPTADANVTGWIGSDTLPAAVTGFPGLTAYTPSAGVNTPLETGRPVALWDTTTPPMTTGMLFGVATVAERLEVMKWVNGTLLDGSDYARSAMADIFHSSPVIVRNPPFSVIDPGFDYFRENLLIQQDGSARPDVMYFATNDGVLHAMLSDAWHMGADGDNDGVGDTTIDAGTELWGFVPPATFPKLKVASTSRTIVFDGSPVVRDLSLAQVPGESEANQRYHSILLVGMRGGGNSYVAMDVTNPLGSDTDMVSAAKPTFLWQFSETDLGKTYAQPGLTEVIIDSDASGTLQRRGVAILPGGVNTAALGVGTCPSEDVSMPAAPEVPDSVYASAKTARANRPCWTSEGRSLYIVDVASGTLLRKWDHLDCDPSATGTATCLVSPMAGDVAVFPSEVGTVATAAYMTDADGVLWRLDLQSADPAEWTLKPLHDVFSSPIMNTDTSVALTATQAALAGKPSFGAPIVSVNDNGDPVIIIATGDLDSLSNPTEINRVVSLTEHYNNISDRYEATVNWEKTMAPGEQVTGPVQLYDSGVYYATFMTQTSVTDSCEFGFSKLCGVHYIDHEPSPGDPMDPLGVLVDSGGDLTACEGDDTGPYLNQVINGVAITQRPTCYTEDDSAVCTDCISGRSKQITDYTVGQVQLVALVGGDGQAISGSASSLSEINKELAQPARNVTALSWIGTAY